MALPNAYSQYNNSKILTASPAELTLLLYEGAIKFGNIAIVKMEHKDVQGAHNNIIRVGKIIDYLRETLDMKYPVAQDFENIYVYLSSRINDTMVSKDPKDMEEVVEHLRSVRDNWKEVMKKAGVR
ncbi:MAG: flagellar export chaperone FliS [Lachnospiraceae bacterium]|nr:flagellar export chaperone FliS [Lachnospiraceae bacterium]